MHRVEFPCVLLTGEGLDEGPTNLHDHFYRLKKLNPARRPRNYSGVICVQHDPTLHGIRDTRRQQAPVLSTSSGSFRYTNKNSLARVWSYLLNPWRTTSTAAKEIFKLQQQWG